MRVFFGGAESDETEFQDIVVDNLVVVAESLDSIYPGTYCRGEG